MSSTSVLPDQSSDAVLLEYVSTYKPSIQILTYCPNSMCTAQYTVSLVRTMELCTKYKINVIIDIERNAESAGIAMNNMIARSLVHPDMTHLMFIDSTVSWEAHDVLRLLLGDKPIVAGVPSLIGYKWDKLFSNAQSQSQSQSPGNKLDSILQKINHPLFQNGNPIHPIDMLQYNLVNYDVKFNSSELKVEDNLTTVDSVSGKFMMVKRMVFERMSRAFPSIKYKYNYLTDMMRAAAALSNKTHDIPDQYGYNFFESTVENEEYIDEHNTFLRRWKNMNGSVHIHLGVLLTIVTSEHQKGNCLAACIS